MRHNAVTGQAAKDRPDINKLGLHPAYMTNHRHDTGPGTPSRRRRRQIARDFGLQWSKRWSHPSVSREELLAAFGES